MDAQHMGEQILAQQVQVRRHVLRVARKDLAQAELGLTRASGRGDRKLVRRYARQVDKAKADIAYAQAQLDELGAVR
jgi:hypothetical protein